MVIKYDDELVIRETLSSWALIGHTADLSQFKNDRGEFKRWLHVFHVTNRPAFHDIHLKVTAVLPWCTSEETVDAEFHRAVNALNGYANYPLVWRSFSWRLNHMDSTPIYGVFTTNAGQHSMFSKIKFATGFDQKELLSEEDEREFWDAMKQFVVVPRQDGGLIPKPFRASKLRSSIYAYSGSSEDSPDAV